jgi:3',5'-cyclic AMP phosphodiesterase CpdA
MRVLHLSDVHVTERYSALPWRKLGWRRWLALLELGPGGRAQAYAEAGCVLGAIAEDAERLGAAHVVVSGDLTAYALDAEFAAARKALGSLADDPARCTVVPGNHDTFTPGSLRSARFERHFGQLLASDLEGTAGEGPYPFVRLLGEEAAVVGLLSARVPRFPGLAHGWLGRPQLEALRRVVADPRLERRAILVAVHHAPRTPRGRPDRRSHGLLDANALLDALRGPRFAILHGHIHRPHHQPSDGVLPHLFGAGSSTERGREGYWCIELADGIVRGAEWRRPTPAP